MNYDVPSGNAHVFYAGGKNGTGTELMRIKGDGHVGIGTSSPGGNKLFVQGNPTISSHHLIVALNTSATPSDLFAIWGHSVQPGGYGNGGRFQGGNLGVYALGDIAILGDGSTYAGYFAGNLHYTGTLSGPSDRRFKEDIEILTGALSKVNNLKIYSYHFKETEGMNFPKEKQMGFIADELEKYCRIWLPMR
ncbi:MAG: tail fiber domain-containing protein [Saprospiraceae bacterium]|nr:tail fiber domain-containing protein [Saprospiraceae bacterium]